MLACPDSDEGGGEANVSHASPCRSSHHDSLPLDPFRSSEGCIGELGISDEDVGDQPPAANTLQNIEVLHYSLRLPCLDLADIVQNSR